MGRQLNIANTLQTAGIPKRTPSASSVPISRAASHYLLTGTTAVSTLASPIFPYRIIQITAQDGLVLTHNNSPAKGQMSFSRGANASLRPGDSVSLQQQANGSWLEVGRGKSTGGTGNFVVEGEVNLPAATFVEIATIADQQAVIESVQLKVITAATASGNTTRIGVGPSGTPVKYGVTASLVLNQAINTWATFAVLGGSETIRVNGVQADGSTQGTGNFTAGRVKYRIVYKALPTLPS